MDRSDIIARLQRHRAELEQRGVLHVVLFGPVARGEDRPGSDIDILIELDDEAVVDVFAYAGIKRHIAGLFDGKVDVVDRAALRPEAAGSSAADAIYAF